MANNGFPSRETVERVRKMYPKGTRVELVQMNDPYSRLKPGDKGTVRFVDDAATVFVEPKRYERGFLAWDSTVPSDERQGRRHLSVDAG